MNGNEEIDWTPDPADPDDDTSAVDALVPHGALKHSLDAAGFSDVKIKSERIDRPVHLVEKPLNAFVETILTSFTIIFHESQSDQPFERGRIHKLTDDLWRDACQAILEETLQCNPQVGLEDSKKAVSWNLHTKG